MIIMDKQCSVSAFIYFFKNSYDSVSPKTDRHTGSKINDLLPHTFSALTLSRHEYMINLHYLSKDVDTLSVHNISI